MAAAGTASVMLSSNARAFGYQSPNDRPVFATIGLRNQGWAITSKTFKFADFAALVDVDSKVLADNVAKTEKKQGKKPDACKDYRKVLDRKDVDAVMIATPDHWHTKIAVEAMHAGKDVYCEKPLTLTIDEGKIIEKAVKETGRVFQVGTMQRTECAHRFLQAVAPVQQGRVGTVEKVTCGIGGFSASPVIPVAPVPGELDWEFWLGPAPKVAYRALAEVRTGYGGGVPFTATGTTLSGTGTSTPVESWRTGARITSTSPVGRSLTRRDCPAAPSVSTAALGHVKSRTRLSVQRPHEPSTDGP
jgi:hypothetical protein